MVLCLLLVVVVDVLIHYDSQFFVRPDAILSAAYPTPDVALLARYLPVVFVNRLCCPSGISAAGMSLES